MVDMEPILVVFMDELKTITFTHKGERIDARTALYGLATGQLVVEYEQRPVTVMDSVGLPRQYPGSETWQLVPKRDT